MKQERPKTKRSSAVVIVLGILLLSAIILYVSISSFYSFIGVHTATHTIDELFTSPEGEIRFAKGDVYICSPCVYSVEHTTNGFTTGTDYYYVIFDNSTRHCMLVKAGSNWDINNFSSNLKTGLTTLGYNSEGVSSAGQVREMDHYARNAFNSFLDHFSEKFALSPSHPADHYLDLTAGRRSLYGILGIVFLAGGSLATFIFVKKNAKRATLISAIFCFAGIILILIYL